MTPELSLAVEGLYDAFRANVPDAITGCPCCIGKRKTDILLTTPLRALTADQLWSYTSGAFLTVGSQRDFTYFLPRIFELEAMSEASIGPEIAFGKLSFCTLNSWPSQRTEALDAFFLALLKAGIEETQADDEEAWSRADSINGLLCGMARGGWSLDLMLEILAHPDNAVAREHLRWVFPDRPKIFWEDVPAEWQQVRDTLFA